VTTKSVEAVAICDISHRGENHDVYLGPTAPKLYHDVLEERRDE
jgi:hypothetical protein